MKSWIEASAGTGKTYTLQNLVLDLILKGIPTHQILVVTFTEKATLELQSRIREQLQTALSKHTGQGYNYIAQGLSDFAELTISTIHGFCRKALVSHPFESGLSFQSEVMNQEDELSQRLRQWLRYRINEIQTSELINAQWTDPQDFLATLQECLSSGILSLPDYPFAIEAYAKADKLIHSIEDSQSSLNLARKDFLQESQRLFSATFDQNFPLQNSLFEKYAEVFNQRSIGKAYRELQILWQVKTLQDWQNWFSLGSDLNLWQTDSKLYKKITKDNQIKNQSWSEKAKGWLESLESLNLELMKFSLTQEAFQPPQLVQYYRWNLLKMLQSDWEQAEGKPWQASDSFLTFNQMISRLAELVKNKNSDLNKSLSQQYKAILIDEFQDTDQNQWNIFKNLFLNPWQEITLVGDPKQSIYGFRGADLGIYLQAKKDLSAQGAKEETLEENFRSTEGIIQALNHLFQDFDFAQDHKPYEKVKKGNKPIPQLYRLDQGQDLPIPAVFRQEIEDQGLTESQAGKQWLNHCVDLTLSFLQGHYFFREDKLPDRPVSPSDILILTGDNIESQRIFSLLSKKGIPATLGTSNGLWDTPQAWDLGIFLLALEKPKDSGLAKLLLSTSLFRLPPDICAALPESVLLKLQQSLWNANKNLIDTGYFKAFFQVMQDMDIQQEGLTVLLAQPGGERFYTDLFHCLELLEQGRINREFAFGKASIWWMNRVKGTSGGETVDLRLDRDTQTLRVLTIHKAKGLEAPIVILAGGLKKPRTQQSLWYTFETPQGRQVDFMKTDSGKVNVKTTEEYQDRRLFYVALTRAKCHLEIPFPKKWSAPEFRSQQRWGKFFCSLGQHNQFLQGIYETHSFSLTPESEGKLTPDPNGLGRLEYSELPSDFLPALKYPKVYSHTSLVKQMQDTRQIDSVFQPKEDLEEESQEDLKKSASDLPAGKEFGTLVHSLFEQIDFRAWSKDPDQIILEQTKEIFAHLLEKAGSSQWYTQLWSLVGATLNHRINLGSSEITLNQFSPEQIRREGEFYLPLKPSAQNMDWHWNPVNGSEGKFKIHSGYLTGFMDLIFSHENKLYILDWKTNLLGPQDTLKQSMIHSRYDLQAYLYWQALHNFPTDGFDLGGVVYLYLRGPQGKPESLFLTPEELDQMDTLMPEYLLQGVHHEF